MYHSKTRTPRPLLLFQFLTVCLFYCLRAALVILLCENNEPRWLCCKQVWTSDLELTWSKSIFGTNAVYVDNHGDLRCSILIQFMFKFGINHDMNGQNTDVNLGMWWHDSSNKKIKTNVIKSDMPTMNFAMPFVAEKGTLCLSLLEDISFFLSQKITRVDQDVQFVPVKFWSWTFFFSFTVNHAHTW